MFSQSEVAKERLAKPKALPASFPQSPEQVSTPLCTPLGSRAATREYTPAGSKPAGKGKAESSHSQEKSFANQL